MTEKEKELKAFNQCADALGLLDRKSVMKVFQLLSVHYEVIPVASDLNHSPRTEEGDKGELKAITIPKNKDDNSEILKSKKTSRSKASATKEPTHLIDYDFRPSGKESLKDFFIRCKPNSNLENNLVFIYYLQNIVGESSINIDHVYSCYRHLNIQIPFFPQTLIDTKRRKGWIDTSDTSNLRVVREGINFLEHELLKQNGE